MGRPTDFTSEIGDRVAQFVRAGNWPEAAAVAAGASKRSFYRWMARGQQAEDAHQEGQSIPASEAPFWQFWQQVKRAEGESEAIAVGYLMQSMPSAPTAVISWLERRFRERWSRTERLEHTGTVGGVIEIEARERLAEKIRALASRSAVASGAAPASLRAESPERESDNPNSPTPKRSSVGEGVPRSW